MTDRHDPVDSDFEARVREAFDRTDPPPAPDALYVQVQAVTHGSVSPPARGGWFRPVRLAAAALAVVLSVTLVGALLTTGRHSTTQGEDGSSSTTEAAIDTCPLSPRTAVGDQKYEVGGPRAFFVTYVRPYRAGTDPWKLLVRFDPDLETGDDVAIFAEHLASGDREDAEFNDPAQVEEAIEGAMYLFLQPFPEGGCWRLTAMVDGELAGTAVIDVAPGTP